METFSLAAVSLTIAISLLIKGSKDTLHRSYALLCLILACERGAFFLYGITDAELLRLFHVLGVIALGPLLVVFSRHLVGKQGEVLSKRAAWYTLALGVLVGLFVFTFIHTADTVARWLLSVYASLVILWCFIALILAVREAQGSRRKRLGYVLTAVLVWAVLSLADILQHLGYAMPSLSEIGAAVLVYFILIVIVYPKLPEFYEILARALIIFILILFVSGLFFAVTALFGQSALMPDFNLVFMASFIIVIFIDPVKLLLKRAVGFFFFEGRTVFTSLFALEDEVEKEKTVFLEEMARGLAHEIRNPLGSIKGAAQYLKTESESEETGQLLGVITEEVDRLERVVSRFLSYANPYVVNAAPRDLNALVERALDLIGRDEVPEEISIVTDFAPDLPLVNIDDEQFMQVIFNLVLNALESMPRGGTLSVSSSMLADERMRAVRFIVSDTGTGIQKEDMKQLFKPFFTTKKNGTGLGLAICRKIINEHGGYIRVTSQVGRGTTFTIILPVE